jgi:hypothetical protein
MSQSRRAVTHLSEWRKARRAKQTQLLRLMTSQGLRRRLTSGQGKMRSVSRRRREAAMNSAAYDQPVATASNRRRASDRRRAWRPPSSQGSDDVILLGDTTTIQQSEGNDTGRSPSRTVLVVNSQRCGGCHACVHETPFFARRNSELGPENSRP